ncbi:peptide ABC transporter substrate-binding protein [Pontibacillus sp. HMF3514]|uniref:peptide ABC transporter substrate-binding protein n=1 Tax=Pontibacillus sp. HMF3514 TaxID=2692425 RepID=UPI00131FD6A5|nr:peptide ABC transporter substrate-binding protein [Pontibacillus sp. HMF3514]QHE51456.1 peptide ABC transporter substrate-binding protein [Pontibacillus sp. HMF3514]
MKQTKWLLLVLTLVLSMFLAACSGGDSENAGEGDGNGETETGENNEGEDTEGNGNEGDGEETKSDGPNGEQVLNLTEGADIPTLDPSMATDAVAFQVLGSTMEGLYRLGENAQIKPGIAKDHEVSEDALTWTFNLREDATWSNGDPVVASDFVYAWKRAVDPETGSEYGPYMMGGVIKNATAINKGEMELDKLGVEAVDETTLKVTLEKPIPYFESLTAFGTFLPINKKAVEEFGEDFALEAGNIYYNGPFVLSEWNHGEGWTFKKNSDYWDADAVSLEQINFKVVKDVATSVNLYETDKVDATGLSAEFVDEYRNNPNFEINPQNVLFYFKYNQEHHEALANTNARKALTMAIDKNGLVNVILNNGSLVATGDIPQDFVTHPETGEDFRDINGDFLTYDKEKAQELWKKAKEELGKDELTIELLAGDSETGKNMNAYFKNQWESNLEGLTIELKQVPFKERLRLDTNMEYDIQFSGWGPDYLDPNTFLNMWVTGGGNNKMGYSNEEYDALIEKANTEYATQPVKRFETFLEAEKVLMNDAAIGPLYQRASASVWKPYVKDVIRNPMGPDFTFKWAYINKNAE